MALGLIDIRAGEKRALLLMSGILAVMTGSHTLLETARDTLFLTKLPPERLALVYVALAVFAVFGGSLSGVASKRFGRRAGLITSLSLAAFFMVLLSLREPTAYMVFGLYLTSGVIGTVVTLQFWLLVGQYFTVSQAKRLFGPMAAGGVLGAALGAAVAATLLRFVPATSLLVVGGGLFLFAAAMVTFIPEADGLDDVDLSPTRALAWVHDFALLRTHRYVALVATLLLVSVAAVLLADYLFKSAAAAELGPAALGTFLGTYYAVQNAVALVVQVFLTGAIVRRLGVTSALLLFPVLLLLGGVGALVTGAFAMALLVKGTDGALRHSLHRVTMELLLLPLGSDVRDRAKRLLETVFARGAQALGAIVIVVLASLGLATTKTLAAMVAGLAVLWFVVALFLRAPYLDLFRRALARGDLADDEQELDLPAVGALLESLSSVDEPTVVAAIELLDTKGRRKLLPALILYHESPAVLNRALIAFAKEPRRDFVPLAERLLGVGDAGVRAGAVRALAVTGRRAAAESALGDADPRVRGTAAFFLANAEQPDSHPAILHVLNAEEEDGIRARAALLDVIAEHGEPHWRGVVERLVSEARVMRLAEAGAADSIRRTRATSCLPLLVELLRRRGAREAARKAITSFGSDGEELLTKTLEDPTQPIASRREIPLTLAELGTQTAADLLMKHLEEKDAILSHRVLRALGRLAAEAKERGARLKFDREVCEKLVEQNLRAYLAILDVRLALEDSKSLAIEDHVSLSLTEGLLVDRSVALLERAFRFLQLANRNEDIRPVFDAVVGGDRRARATAMEFLDALTLGEATIRELLRVVADDLEPSERVRRGRVVRGLPPDLPSAEETLQRLITDEEPLLAALAVVCARSARSTPLERVVEETRVNRPEVMLLASDEDAEVLHA